MKRSQEDGDVDSSHSNIPKRILIPRIEHPASSHENLSRQTLMDTASCSSSSSRLELIDDAVPYLKDVMAEREATTLRERAMTAEKEAEDLRLVVARREQELAVATRKLAVASRERDYERERRKAAEQGEERIFRELLDALSKA